VLGESSSFSNCHLRCGSDEEMRGRGRVGVPTFRPVGLSPEDAGQYICVRENLREGGGTHESGRMKNTRPI
jgi:hypothetical protein